MVSGAPKASRQDLALPFSSSGRQAVIITLHRERPARHLAGD